MRDDRLNAALANHLPYHLLSIQAIWYESLPAFHNTPTTSPVPIYVVCLSLLRLCRTGAREGSFEQGHQPRAQLLIQSILQYNPTIQYNGMNTESTSTATVQLSVSRHLPVATATLHSVTRRAALYPGQAPSQQLNQSPITNPGNHPGE